MKQLGFICTGNTCRSPMAECYFKNVIKDYKDKINVFSAGISAGFGWKAAFEAIMLMNRYGLDLSTHMSKPLDDKLVNDSDMLIVMTDMHKETLMRRWPFAANKIYLLREFDIDADKMIDLNIKDPVGCPIEIYEKCFENMKSALERLGDILCKELY